ncbi:hypothetical protein [Vibrio nitrifigilis]|uniref:Uncharacterized protein n=1 Tax=Vibrio nitrifigilis TaxID=2789781 RepID=A0ABS0GLM2_9VIBR|nr:hypothetical protein [Vibrio nitrifigilis]MBF9003328.1 hypothetical protein [Vibrio nitrifigilis]
MVELKRGISLSVDNISNDIFESEPGSYVLETIIVDDGKLLLVKEIIPKGLSYTFFDLSSGLKIDISDRVKSENGMELKKIFPNGLTAVMKITVDQVSGAEIVTDSIFDGDAVVYQCERERYPEITFDEFYHQYLVETSAQIKEKESYEQFINKFSKASVDEQVKLLKTEFRNKWRSNCELGFEHPEYFLTKDMYNSLKKTPSFFDALKRVLIAEEVFIGENADKLYKNILNHYES